MKPKEVLDTINRSIENSGELPDFVSYTSREINLEGQEDSNVDLPLVETFFVSDIRASVHNTDLAGYVTDTTGNRIGAIYEPEWEARIQINTWTVPQDLANISADGWIFDPRQLSARVRSALWTHDSHAVGEPFTDTNGNDIDDLTYFRIDESEPDNDFTTSPTLLQWHQEVRVNYNERVTTDDEAIEVVDGPQSGDFTSSDAEIIIERTL